ncbi:MAG: hypothetical protein ABI821_06895 [Pseudomonadota bacterium]
MTLNREDFQLLTAIRGDDDEETQLLRDMGKEAKTFITEHEWCPPIRGFYLAYGIGGVVALFLVDFSEAIADSPDDSLWVVVGDLPSAYFVSESADTPRAALECYCYIMDDWIAAAVDDTDMDEVYPLEIEPTEKNARELQSRLDFLRTEIIPGM